MTKLFILSLFLFLSLAPLVSAETKTNVSVKSNTGSNTVCKNGECTTTGGENHSKVCVNGECYETEEGDIDVQAVNGTTTVKINDKVVTPSLTKPTTTPTISPTEEQHKSSEEVKQEVKALMTKAEHQTDWVAILTSHAFTVIKKLFLFSFI